MKEDFSDIDKLFRDELSNAAFNPPPGVWESVSAGISAQSAAVTAAGAAKSGLLAFIKSYWLWVGVAAICVASVIVINSDSDTQPVQSAETVNLFKKQGTEESTVISDADANEEKSAIKNQSSPVAPDERRNTDAVQTNTEQPSHSVSANPIQEIRDKSHNDPKKQGMVIPHHEPVKNNPVPATGNATVKAMECPHSLVIQAEMISNRLVAFKASGYTGPVKWDFGDGHLSGGLKTQHEYKDETANYIVKSYSTSINGCTDSALYPVSVIGSEANAVFVPDYLTPNGDGLNDELKIEIGVVRDYNLIIFDSHNRPVFTSSDPGISWNGKSGIRDCDAGTYNLVLSYRLKDSSQSKVIRKRILLKK